MTLDSQGKTYDGVGDVDGVRANQSKTRLEKDFPDETFEIDSRTPYDDRVSGLKAEDKGIWRTGQGPQGKKENGVNYNKINAPGHTLNNNDD